MTKEQLIEQFKLDYPTLTKQFNDEVITLNQDEYEAIIDSWADVQLAKIAKAAEAETQIAAKAALLDRLGISEAEAKLLLS